VGSERHLPGFGVLGQQKKKPRGGNNSVRADRSEKEFERKTHHAGEGTEKREDQKESRSGVDAQERVDGVFIGLQGVTAGAKGKRSWEESDEKRNEKRKVL